MCRDGKPATRRVIKNVSWAICDKCNKPIRGSGISLGAVVCWNLKDFVRKGERVSFCDNWARLCEATGFRVFLRAHALLSKTEDHPGLFEAEVKTTKSRKSFFRRLHESRPGAVKIDFEEVIFCRKEKLA